MLLDEKTDQLTATPEVLPGTEVGQPLPPETPPVIPEVPERYRGKSIAELVAIAEEREKHIGTQAKEIGDLRNDMGYLRNMVEQAQSQPPQPTFQQQAPPPGPPKFDYERPEDSALAIYEWKEKQRDEQRRREDDTRKLQDAQDFFNEGRENAYRSNPKLFKGMEREVEQAVWSTAQTGFLRPANLRHLDTWETAAIIIAKRKGELDRIVPSTIQPVSATPTERPASAKGGVMEADFPIDLSDFEVQQFMRERGLTEKQAREIIRKEAGIAQQGEFNTRYRGRI